MSNPADKSKPGVEVNLADYVAVIEGQRNTAMSEAAKQSAIAATLARQVDALRGQVASLQAQLSAAAAKKNK